MADAKECRRQALECSRLSQTSDVAPRLRFVLRGMAKSWITLANQMDRLAAFDRPMATHLALAR